MSRVSKKEEAIKAKYSPEESKDDDNSIPEGSICVQEEMVMQRDSDMQSPKLNINPHRQEAKE